MRDVTVTKLVRRPDCLFVTRLEFAVTYTSQSRSKVRPIEICLSHDKKGVDMSFKMIRTAAAVALAVMSQLVASGRAAPMVLLLGIATLGIGIWCLVMLILLLTRLARAVMSDVQLPQAFS